MTPTDYFLLIAFLLTTELVYLRVARQLGLFDKPNLRSAHTGATIVRGGGILFYVAVWSSLLIGRLDKPYFLAGLTLVALVSFWDDLFTLRIRYRLMAQFLAVGLLLMQFGYLANPWWLVVGLIVLCAGILNAYNFMDGINGMTAFYSLVTVATLWYWQARQEHSEQELLLPGVFIALLIFTYFNARAEAVCFAGDVGSMSIGFISLYVLLNTISQSHTYLPILFLAVYGVDTVLTILHRLRLGQPIFQAHRLHLFQRLVHELRWPHLRVSALYALVQLGINALVLKAIGWSPTAQWLVAGAVVGSLSALYVVATKRLTSQ